MLCPNTRHLCDLWLGGPKNLSVCFCASFLRQTRQRQPYAPTPASNLTWPSWLLLRCTTLLQAPIVGLVAFVAGEKLKLGQRVIHWPPIKLPTWPQQLRIFLGRT